VLKGAFYRNILVLICVCGTASQSFAPALAQPLPVHSVSSWRKLADDLERAEVGLAPGSPLGGQLVFLRTALQRYRVGVIRAAQFGWQRAGVKSLCRAARAVICINANFFDETGEPLGLIVSRGTEYRKIHRGGHTLTGIFQVTRLEPKIINRADYSPDKVVEAVQAGPRLLSNGVRIPGLRDTRSSRRAGLCIGREGHLLFFCSATTLSSLSVEDLQTILLAEPMKCLDALNLDGGGSAQLYVSAELPGAPKDLQELHLPGGNEVPVALGLFVETEAELP